jgi:hypothetical protein
MRHLAVVVLDPLPELREHRLGVAEIGVTEVIALERPHEGFGQPVALRAVRRGRDRDQAELVGVEHRSGGGVLRAVVGEPLHRISGPRFESVTAHNQRRALPEHRKRPLRFGQRRMCGHTASTRAGWIGRGSTGKPPSCHASNPPARGRIREMPRLRNRSATRALVASFGQEQ